MLNVIVILPITPSVVPATLASDENANGDTCEKQPERTDTREPLAPRELSRKFRECLHYKPRRERNQGKSQGT